jgi:RNA polymerase sigma factor (TIGR02999 family)
LQQFALGYPVKSRSQLFDEFYEQLRRLARNRLARENDPKSATSLVHEVYLKIRGWRDSFQNDEHFLATASLLMRQVLVDRARLRLAQKRGARVEPLSVSIDSPAEPKGNVIDVLILDQLLGRLAEFDPRAVRVTEMRVFLGLNEDEIADVLQVSTRTVKRDWVLAKTWLKAEMAQTANPIEAPPKQGPPKTPRRHT